MRNGVTLNIVKKNLVKMTLKREKREKAWLLKEALGLEAAGSVWQDLGHLSSFIERGYLREEKKITSPANMPVTIATLLDIARGMAYVHQMSTTWLQTVWYSI
eukprot:s903_g1.t1